MIIVFHPYIFVKLKITKITNAGVGADVATWQEQKINKGLMFKIVHRSLIGSVK